MNLIKRFYKEMALKSNEHIQGAQVAAQLNINTVKFRY